MTETKLERKHSLATRWFHWINFPVLALMVWSGLLIYWANDVYRIGWGDWTLVKFSNPSVYRALNMNNHLSQGMAWHFTLMWLFSLNGLLYVVYTLVSGQWRELVPKRGTLKEAFQVVLYDLKLSKVHPPRKKFNGAQQIAYTSIIIMGLGSLLTGLAIYKPVQLGWLRDALGGYEIARAVHFALTLGYLAFFLVHVGQVMRAGWNNFRAMVTGFELAPIEPTLAVPVEEVAS